MSTFHKINTNSFHSFEAGICVSNSSFYGHYKYVYSYSAGTDFSRQIRTTKVGPRAVRVKHDYSRAQRFNPLTAGADYIGFVTQLLPHSVPPFKHVKAVI